MKAIAESQPAYAHKTATADKLLEAAGEIFAAKGFHGATVREICGKAGANIAAANYYFRDKESLYRAAFRHLVQSTWRDFPLPAGLKEGAAGPEDRLASFVQYALHRVLQEGGPKMLWQMVLWEMAAPIGAIDILVEELARPLQIVLRGIVRELLGPRADNEAVIRCAFSVMSQCMFYRFSQPVVVRLDPHLKFDEPTISALARHIARFSLDAIRCCKPTRSTEKLRAGPITIRRKESQQG